MNELVNKIEVVKSPYKKKYPEWDAIYFMETGYPKDYHPETYISVEWHISMVTFMYVVIHVEIQNKGQRWYVEVPEPDLAPKLANFIAKDIYNYMNKMSISDIPVLASYVLNSVKNRTNFAKDLPEFEDAMSQDFIDLVTHHYAVARQFNKTSEEAKSAKSLGDYLRALKYESVDIYDSTYDSNGVAFDYDPEGDDYYDKVLELIANELEITKIHEYHVNVDFVKMMHGKHSKAFETFILKHTRAKKNWDRMEEEDKEEFFINVIEDLAAGNYSEEDYRELYDLMTGKGVIDFEGNVIEENPGQKLLESFFNRKLKRGR